MSYLYFGIGNNYCKDTGNTYYKVIDTILSYYTFQLWHQSCIPIW